jgi:hypothetical protein
MTPIEVFGWALSAILGIGFIILLATVSREPRYTTEMEHKRPDLMNKMNGFLKKHN